MFKWLTLPKNNETEQVQVLQTWRVTWLSRYGEYSGNTRKEVEIFLNEADARHFKESLENAYKLLKHTSGTSIVLVKN